MFAPRGAVRKWRSMSRPPPRKASKSSGPIAIISESPIGPHTE